MVDSLASYFGGPLDASTGTRGERVPREPFHWRRWKSPGPAADVDVKGSGSLAGKTTTQRALEWCVASYMVYLWGGWMEFATLGFVLPSLPVVLSDIVIVPGSILALHVGLKEEAGGRRKTSGLGKRWVACTLPLGSIGTGTEYRYSVK